jgi:Na+-driven multidrug efflux pump
MMVTLLPALVTAVLDPLFIFGFGWAWTARPLWW